MSDPNFYLCDICEDRTNYRLHVPVEWISCPAGGSSEIKNKILDLCGNCLYKIVAKEISKMDIEQGKDFVKRVEAVK